jgi:hypothetical protein
MISKEFEFLKGLKRRKGFEKKEKIKLLKTSNLFPSPFQPRPTFFSPSGSSVPAAHLTSSGPNTPGSPLYLSSLSSHR